MPGQSSGGGKRGQPPAKKPANRSAGPRKPTKKAVKRKSRWLAKLGIAACAAVVVFGGLVVWFLSVLNTPIANLNQLAQTSAPTLIYDRDNQVAFKIPPKGVINVPLSKIPMKLQDALIATEDAGFYHHTGFSIKGYVRAALYDLIHHDEAQGASTITQQLAKFVFLSDAKTFERKFKQLVLSIQISRRFSKHQILDMYFNRVYFGQDATGIGQAAFTYFDLEPNQLSHLTLDQAALLAGLPQAPSLYDPLVNPKLARVRRNEVLGRMYFYKYISRAQYKRAIAAPLGLHPGPPDRTGVPPQYQYIRDYLYTEFHQLHLSTQLLTQGGLHIYTELDPQLQLATYDQINSDTYYPTPLPTATEEIEGAAVFINPHTGAIEALVGGKENEYTYRGFDYATQTQRSPGSAMKPLVVYGPAIESGRWNANSALLDGVNNQLSFGNYTVSDWEQHPTDHGYVSLRWALAESWNCPAVWLLDQIGIQNGIAFAERAGINLSSPADDNLTIALGNVIPGISPLQLADAYSAFDNNGVRIPAHLIDRVTTADGQVLYNYIPQPVTVMTPQTATKMVALLENNVVNGIVAGAAVPGHQVAGKTGSVAFTNTSGTDSDLWVAAFTPNVVGAVWEGYPDTTLANSLPQWSSKYPPEMFSAILSQGLPPDGASFGIPVAAGSPYPSQLPGQSSQPTTTTGATYGYGN
jgi:penicillin-binding protein 2A